MSPIRTGLRAILLAAAVVVSPIASAGAQAQSHAAGPTMSAASVGARRSADAGPLDARESLAGYQLKRGNGQAVALMVVGGAAIVVGALADGDVGPLLLLGGAVIGLYGLYLYLK